MERKRIIVIGGGPSGMMAAITAAKEGAFVTIIEHNERIGKKILSTGNGRCNFTNTQQEPDCYRSDNTAFPWKVISAYSAAQTIADFTAMGIYSKNKNGCLYPFSEQASAVLDVLRMEIARLEIQVQTAKHVVEIQKKGRGLLSCIIAEGKKRSHIEGEAVILACGSKAAEKLGSDGSGYTIAKKLGHHIVPVVPALIQLRCKEDFFKALAGVRTHGKVTIRINGKACAADTGEIQLVDYGISGIPVFQVSRFAAKAVSEKKNVAAVLDFMPDFTREQMLSFLRLRVKEHPEKTMDVFFTGVLHKKLSGVLLKQAGIPFGKTAGNLTEQELIDIVEIVKGFTVQVTQPNPFGMAQVCAGGVDTREVNPDTMESLLVKGVYFAGELLDVDGMCGGYNLQWAWSSGYLAGKGAAHA
ncbi:MAG: NAD(P)/FAD-dependent oxidoreductase [Coprococcus sp.]|nr:NAD(P)/FAD-dependent oxidoreductase [Coprococcus sp.]